MVMVRVRASQLSKRGAACSRFGFGFGFGFGVALRHLLADVPRLEGAALDLDRGRAVPDVAREGTGGSLRRIRRGIRSRLQAKVCAGGRCKRRQVCTSSMMGPMDRCGVVSRAAPWRENEAAEPTSARATMEW